MPAWKGRLEEAWVSWQGLQTSNELPVGTGGKERAGPQIQGNLAGSDLSLEITGSREGGTLCGCDREFRFLISWHDSGCAVRQDGSKRLRCGEARKLAKKRSFQLRCRRSRLPETDRAVEQGDGFLVMACVVEFRHSHAPEPYGRNRQSLSSEFSLIHLFPIPRCNISSNFKNKIRCAEVSVVSVQTE